MVCTPRVSLSVKRPRCLTYRMHAQAWHLYQDRLDTSSEVVAFVPSIPGLAFLHHLGSLVKSTPKGTLCLAGHILPKNEETATKNMYSST